MEDEFEVDLSRKRVWGLNDVFTFGKYKGSTVKDVIKIAPDYCIWCHNNISWFTLDEDLLLQCEEKVERARDRQRISHPLFGEPDPFDGDDGDEGNRGTPDDDDEIPF